MTVVVTGASGFLGRHIVDAFLARGRDVVGLTRDRRRLDARPRLTIVETNYDRVELPRSCSVVHLAAVRNAPGATANELTRVNVEVAQRVARAAVDSGAKRFIHFPTALVFGSSTVPIDDGAPLVESSDPYVRSKLAGLRALEAMDALPLVSLLPTIVYGPDHPLARNRITSHIRSVLARPFRLAISGAAAPRNLVFVDDVVRAVVEAEERDTQRRTLVAGEDATQQELERAVFAAANRKPTTRIVVPRALAYGAARAADAVVRREQSWTRRIDTLLAPWSFRPSEPHTPLAHGVAQTVRSL